MGQNHPQIKESVEYQVIEELAVGNIVKHNKTDTLHFLKQYSYTSQEPYQNALNTHSLKLANKNEHILNFLHFTTKSQNSFCSSFHKIILIFEYSQYTLQSEIANRLSDSTPFTQKEIWSVLCSCVLAAVHLIHTQGKMHSAITAKDIRLSGNGCIKLLSHQMIGIDPMHNQNHGTPKMLAITLLECINLEKVTNQDVKYLQRMVEMLGNTKEMKDILRSMIRNQVTFLELEEYLIKLVQDEESLASNSNTPVLKSYNPLVSSNYKCPKPIPIETPNNIPEPCSESQSPCLPDQQDLKAYLYEFDEASTQIENPDQTQEEQPEQQGFQSQIDSPKEINSFYLKEKKNQSNLISIENRTEELKMMNRKDYEINRVQSSRRRDKENCENAPEISVKGNYEIGTTGTNNESLFTDPKLFSLIKNDLQEIKMRRSIGELARYPKDPDTKLNTGQFAQFKSDPTPSNPFTTLNPQPKQHNQSKAPPTSELTNSPKQTNGWFKGAHLSSSYSLPSLGADGHGHGFKQIQMIREVSQEYREDDDDKQRSSLTRDGAMRNYKSQKELQNYSDHAMENIKPVAPKLDNIMSDEGLGFRKKKQSSVSIVQPTKEKQEDLLLPSKPNTDSIQHISHHSSQHISHHSSQHSIHSSSSQQHSNSQTSLARQGGQKNQQKPQKCLPSQRSEQYFHQSSRQQSSRSSCSSNVNMSNMIEKEKLIQVSERYTRGHYEGTKLNGKRHGHGTFFYSEGGKYVGNWKENKMHGRGTLYYPSQKVAYEGEWENDQLSGYGVLYNEEVANLRTPFDYRDWSDVEEFWIKYEGHFQQDNKEGQGKLYLVNGERFEGQFHDDKVDGQGILHRGDGSSVRGKWRQNKLIRLF